MSENKKRKYKFRDPFDEDNLGVFLCLVVSYLLLTILILLGWIALVTTNFDPLPYGIPILFSPALLVVLWKGIERAE